MSFVESTSRDAFGAIVIRSRLTLGTKRQGFENNFFPGIEVGLEGWQRAHSQGAGTGCESPHAIRYAPAEVNQRFQNQRIERYLRDIIAAKPSDVDLWLTTVTSTHPRTLRLREIQYRVDAVRNHVANRLFEASIEIEDSRFNPRVTIQATPFSPIN